jgi:hypothetical protein
MIIFIQGEMDMICCANYSHACMRKHVPAMRDGIQCGESAYFSALVLLQVAHPSGLRPRRSTCLPVSLRQDTHAAAATTANTMAYCT